MEKNGPKQRLLQSKAFTKAIEFLDAPELLSLRELNKKFGEELVPKCFKRYRFYLPDDEEDASEIFFYKKVKNLERLEIENIEGTEFHLNFVKDICKNNTNVK